MIIRRELPSDTEAIQALFSNVSSEVFFDKLHTDSSWLPALSFVVIDRDDDVVGHVAATRGQVGSAHALALVPPSVDPEERDRGVGQALMHAVLGAADALDESLVGLVAIPPGYYSRFGFRPAEEYGITPPVGGWRPYFLMRPLTAFNDAMRGTFTFPDPFL